MLKEIKPRGSKFLYSLWIANIVVWLCSSVSLLIAYIIKRNGTLFFILGYIILHVTFTAASREREDHWIAEALREEDTK